MTFVTSIKTCLRKYADFRGRAARSELWWFFFFQFLLGILAVYVDLMVLGRPAGALMPVGLTVKALFFVPSWAVSGRRLHDLGVSAWYAAPVFVGMIVVEIAKVTRWSWFLEGTIAGPLVITLFACLMLMAFGLRGAVGPNRFGEDPVPPPKWAV